MSQIEYASILSSESGNQHVKPTIFDIIAQENMHTLFRLSFNHLFKWFSSNFPNLSKLRKFSDEFYLLMHSSIEFLYLKEYDALFSEYFYGLKRFGLNNNRKKALSVVFSIVVPYLKAKLDNLYEDIEKNEELTPTNNRNKISLKYLILKFYPYFHLLWSIVFWYYRFRYMINSSDYNSPLLSILGIKLGYDLNERNLNKSGLLKNILLFSNTILTNALFFIQFLKWYQDNSENESYNTQEMDLFSSNTQNEISEQIIPPPKLPQKLINNKFYKNITEKNLCPLCNKKRTNECVLSVSGFIFCYPCIFKFVKMHKRCPLTNFPCNTKNILRIYASE